MKEDLSKLDLIGLLDQLKPVVAPDKISLWPQTASWVVIAVLALIVGGLLCVRWLRAYRADAHRRAALRAITEVGDDPSNLADILRRCALVAYPRDTVAALHGEEWLSFLDSTYGGTEFSQGIGRRLATAAYARPSSTIDGLSELTAKWVRDHNRKLASAYHD